MVVEQSNVGETPQVVEDQAHQRAVRQQLQGYNYHKVLSVRPCQYSYFCLGSETDEVGDQKLEGEVEDGVEVEGERDGGLELLSSRLFLYKGDVPKSASSREPAGSGQEGSEEL